MGTVGDAGTTGEMARMAGPGAGRRAAPATAAAPIAPLPIALAPIAPGPMALAPIAPPLAGPANRLTRLGVMPAVAAVGAMDESPVSGRAEAKVTPGTACAIGRTGCDATMAAAGICVAAARLRKFWIDVVLLLVTLVTFDTLAMLTFRI